MSVGEISPPMASLTCTRSSWSSQHPRHHDWIETHWFNHKVDVIIPNYNQEATTKLLHRINEEHNYTYYRATTSFSAFIDPKFMDSYIKKGKLYVISTSTPLDSSNVSAALFNGKLQLVVNKDTYEQLGLVGAPSAFPPKGRRYNITIDLLKPSFVPGRKFYERVKWCLEKIADATFLYSFTLDDRPATIEFSPTSTHRQLPLSPSPPAYPLIPTPDPSSITSLPSDDLPTFLYSLHTWSEFVNFGLKPPDLSQEGYPLTYRKQNVATISWRGLIPPAFIHNLIRSLREELKEKGIPFVVVSVTGFEDSPVSWGTKEHGVEKSGENAYTFFLFPNDQFWYFVALGANDEYR